jgi:hypothetical protein
LCDFLAAAFFRNEIADSRIASLLLGALLMAILVTTFIGIPLTWVCRRMGADHSTQSMAVIGATTGLIVECTILLTAYGAPSTELEIAQFAYFAIFWTAGGAVVGALWTKMTAQ